MYTPQLCQLPQQTVLAARHSPNRCSCGAWAEWCSSLTMDTATPSKAETPIHARRKQQKKPIQSHCLQKKPAPGTTNKPNAPRPIQMKKKGAARKRHPLILQRIRRRKGGRCCSHGALSSTYRVTAQTCFSISSGMQQAFCRVPSGAAHLVNVCVCVCVRPPHSSIHPD